MVDEILMKHVVNNSSLTLESAILSETSVYFGDDKFS